MGCAWHLCSRQIVLELTLVQPNPAVTGMIVSLGAMFVHGGSPDRLTSIRGIARKLPLQDPEYLPLLRGAYIGMQLLVLAVYYFCTIKVRDSCVAPRLRFPDRGLPLAFESLLTAPDQAEERHEEYGGPGLTLVLIPRSAEIRRAPISRPSAADRCRSPSSPVSVTAARRPPR